MNRRAFIRTLAGGAAAVCGAKFGLIRRDAEPPACLCIRDRGEIPLASGEDGIDYWYHVEPIDSEWLIRHTWRLMTITPNEYGRIEAIWTDGVGVARIAYNNDPETYKLLIEQILQSGRRDSDTILIELRNRIWGNKLGSGEIKGTRHG